MPAYRTANINLAAFLRAQGHRLVTADRGGRQVVFGLEDPDGRLSERVSAFQNGEALVNARHFIAELNSLRDLIFKERRDESPNRP